MTLECPKCKSPVAREGQRFCYRCGYELRDYYDSLNIEIKDSRPDSNPLPASPPDDTAASGEKVVPNMTAEFSSPQLPAASAATQTGGTVALNMEEVGINTESIIVRHTSEQKAMLRILLPTGDVFDREITQTETQMGKGPRNDVVIADPAVSAAHAMIRIENGEYVVNDLGSRNGTYVNGERIIAPHSLKHGDVIGLGLSKITFRLGNHSETGAIDVAEIIRPPMTPPLTEDSLAAAAIAEGLVKESDIRRLRGGDAGGRRLYRALLEDGLASEEGLRDLMGRTFHIPTIDLGSAQVDKSVVERLAARTARDRLLFPVAEESGSVILAVADPTDTEAVEGARREVGLSVSVRLATASEILEQVDRHYGPRLVGLLPSGEKLEYFINLHETEIGKASHNHIVLSDPTVSNTHAILIARDKAYSIVDLGSRNGTFVNGERLGAHAHTLRHGDTIQLGQTVLTFKNRAETTANVTATLSPAALAEIRKRAGAGDNSEASPQKAEEAAAPAIVIPMVAGAEAAPAQAAENITPVQASAEASATGEDDKTDKKKKKKKKGEDARLKAAYISGLSRILAQILAVILSVGLALYITQRNSSSEKPVAEIGSKGKAKMKIASPGAGTVFKGGVFEASGVVQVPGTNGVYFVDDSKPGQIFWMELDQSGKQVGEQVKPIDFGASVADPEGIAYGASFFYVIGSQSHSEVGDRNALVRFAFDSSNQNMTKVDVIANLRDFLIEKVPELKEASERSGNDGGLNVEGVAWDIPNERLLLGLRSPLVAGKALVVPVKLRDPLGPFSKENLDVAGSAIGLSLGGLAIRDIQYDPKSASFLIIAGPSSRGETTAEYSLWEWNGNADQSNADSTPHELTKLDSKMKPEGVTRVEIGGRKFIFIVGDGSSYMKVDLADTP
jgi:pSer/pThr/pTyr-binding forkhead associated (FHA) protein